MFQNNKTCLKRPKTFLFIVVGCAGKSNPQQVLTAR
jgi:hypothetical protein